MLQTIVVYSLIITGIYVAFQQGNVLGWLRIAVANGLDKAIGKKWSRYIQKPLWDCLPCMASVWTVVLDVATGVSPWQLLLLLILGVCGLNALLEYSIIKSE